MLFISVHNLFAGSGLLPNCYPTVSKQPTLQVAPQTWVNMQPKHMYHAKMFGYETKQQTHYPPHNKSGIQKKKINVTQQFTNHNADSFSHNNHILYFFYFYFSSMTLGCLFSSYVNNIKALHLQAFTTPPTYTLILC